MATILGKIIRGVAAGAGTVLSLIPGVGTALSAAITAIGAVGSGVKNTTDRVSAAVNNAVETGTLPKTNETPATVTSTGSGFIITTPMWLVIILAVLIIFKPFKRLFR
jgi:hypothetical protein